MPTRLHGEHRGEIDISRIASAPSLALYLDLDAALAPMAPTPHLAWLEPEMRRFSRNSPDSRGCLFAC